MPNPTCPTNCDFAIPEVVFDDCSPVVVFSEIRRIFMAKKAAASFTDWTEATEWLARLSQVTTTGDDYIRALTVIGDKPAAADVSKDISNGRKIVIGKDHTVNFTIDDVSDQNYEFMRGLECGGEFKFWYETSGGYLYGGNDGFLARVSMNDILNRGTDEIETIAGVVTWRSKFSPERTPSPIFGTSGGSAPTSYDTIIGPYSSTPLNKSAAGVTGTVSATDADQKFEFNAISSPIGTPATMNITVSTVLEIVIDFPNDYIGQYFKYTDKAGTAHVSQFVNGTKAF